MLLGQALEREADLGLGVLADELEHLLDVGDVLLRLGQMVLERRAELVVLDLGDQLGERLRRELALDVENVAELVHEQLTRGSDFGHGVPPVVWGARGCGAWDTQGGIGTNRSDRFRPTG